MAAPVLPAIAASFDSLSLRTAPRAPSTSKQATNVTDPTAPTALLRTCCEAAYPEHTQLHAEWTPLQHLPDRLDHAQEHLYTLKGRLTTSRTACKRIDTQVQAAHKAYKKLRPPLAKSLVLPTRRKKCEAAHVRWQGLVAERESAGAQVTALQDEIAAQERSIDAMREGIQRLAVLDKRLTQLDATLFDGPTPSHPEEDELESLALILASTARLLQAESEREVRCRQKLVKALTPLEAVLANLKKALAISLDAGVPTNTKYTQQLFVNSSPVTVSKRITPHLHTAKTESGKGHTLFAEARGTQLLVRPLPVMRLLDLNKMPGRVSGVDIQESMSERSIHASLETSYAQSQAQLAHVKREIDRSKRRTRFFKRRMQGIWGEERQVRLALRMQRRIIVEDLVVGSTGRASKDVAALPDDDAFQFTNANGEDFDDDGTTLGGGNEEEDALRSEAQRAESEAVGGAAGPEADMFRLRQDAAGNPVSAGADGSQAALDEGRPLLTVRTPSAAEETLMSRSGSHSGSGVGTDSSQDNEEDAVPVIRNPRLFAAAGADLDKVVAVAGAAGLAEVPASHPLNPTRIVARSTRALRRIMRECVREVRGAEADDDEPGYGGVWSMT